MTHYTKNVTYYHRRNVRENPDWDSYYRIGNFMKNRMDSNFDSDNIDMNRDWDDDGWDNDF